MPQYYELNATNVKKKIMQVYVVIVSVYKRTIYINDMHILIITR